MDSGKAKRTGRMLPVFLSFILASGCAQTYEFEYLYEDLPFSMERIERPSIPDREVCLSDFGGKGDGIAMNTEAFRSAIEHLSSLGGGHLVVPEGIWLTGPITLKDNIDLHVTPNAVILFSPDRDLYPIVETVFEGLDTFCEIFINGNKAAVHNNMFLPLSLDVTSQIKAQQRNILVIRFFSPTLAVRENNPEKIFSITTSDRIFARKAQMNYSWDFAPDV